MGEQFYWLIVGVLCTWRMTHLIAKEDGPWAVIARLRRLAGNGFWGDLMDCFYCLSLWIAIPFALLIGAGWRSRILLAVAFSAGAVLVESFKDKPATPASVYFEHKPGGDDHVVLRQDEGASAWRNTAGS